MTEGKPVSALDIGVDQGTTNALGGMTRRLSMKIAKIKNVNADTNTVDLEWLWPIRGGANNIDISRPYVGFRSGIHFVPEVGSVVVIGYAFNQMIMLSYLLPSDYSKMLQGYEDNKGIPARIRQMSPGEISMNSIQNSEIYLHEQVEIQDRNLNNIIIDPTDDSINLNSLIFYLNNEGGNIVMGPITRTVDGSSTIITNDGEPVISSVGGKALTEFNLKVKEFADGTIFDDSANNTLANITVGTLVNDAGKKVLNQVGNQIVCNIEFSSGVNLQVDSKGNFNISGGNMLNPSDPSITLPDSLSQSFTGTTISKTQQRAAREGDRVIIPITTPLPNHLVDHPELASKAVYNLAQMAQMATMFMSPVGPCFFVPSIQDIRLAGEITQGSNNVFIGSEDKKAEYQENKNNDL